MKNAIQYYYGIQVNDVHLIENNYFFTYNGFYYVLYYCNMDDEEIEKAYNFQKELYLKQIYTHQILENNQKKIITIINYKKYVLMKMYDKMDRKVDEELITNFSYNTLNFFSDNFQNAWKNMWEKKIDYFEYQLEQIDKKFPKIRRSFNFFAGIVEIGISLLNNDVKCQVCISHKRISSNSTTFDLYNPFNFIVDCKIRDICEYYKYDIDKKENIYDDIEKYIKKSNLFSNDLYYFFIRMLFPSFYFDKYEKIISQYFSNNIVDESCIDNIEKIADKYENLLKKLYIFIKKYINIPTIEWLESNQKY